MEGPGIRSRFEKTRTGLPLEPRTLIRSTLISVNFAVRDPPKAMSSTTLRVARPMTLVIRRIEIARSRTRDLRRIVARAYRSELLRVTSCRRMTMTRDTTRGDKVRVRYGH